MGGSGSATGSDNDGLLVIEEILAHHGVKGMHWGVRRSEKQLEKARKLREASSEDANRVRDTGKKIKTEGVHSLSNQELKDYLERADLMKRYNASQPPGFSKEAGKFIKDVLVNAGKQEATKFVSKQMQQALASAAQRQARS